MSLNTSECGDSEICRFFDDTTVFLTGATGFLGKLFLEKLLRACNVNQVYILVRIKKGKDAVSRFNEIFDEPIFDGLKRKKFDFNTKAKLLHGDCSLPNLGLSETDVDCIKTNVNIIIHCAATVRFDQTLRIAANINVRAVLDLLSIAKQTKNLKSFVHISTAYSNCIRRDIDEQFYDSPMSPHKLLSLLDDLEDDHLEKLTPILLDQYPNTYTYTKAVAENAIKIYGKTLPIAVCRPSIVISTAKEPIAAWINNIYGATGVFLGVAMGVLRTLQCRKNNLADMIPADYVINGALAVAWETGLNKKENDEVLVYNFVSSPEKKITWDEFSFYTNKHGTEIPTALTVWHHFLFNIPNRWLYLFVSFWMHTIPAYVADFIAKCAGKEQIFVKGYEKISNFSDVIAYFSMKEWKFTNNNVQELWRKMNTGDQELFEFSMSNLNWNDYFRVYVKGVRIYILKDPMETIPAGLIKYKKLQIAHYTLVTVLLLCFVKVLTWLF